MFALAFENALLRDYVSEKMYGALAAGAIPLYRGAPNVDEYTPGALWLLPSVLMLPGERAT